MKLKYSTEHGIIILLLFSLYDNVTMISSKRMPDLQFRWIQIMIKQLFLVPPILYYHYEHKITCAAKNLFPVIDLIFQGSVCISAFWVLALVSWFTALFFPLRQTAWKYPGKISLPFQLKAPTSITQVFGVRKWVSMGPAIIEGKEYNQILVCGLFF